MENHYDVTYADLHVAQKPLGVWLVDFKEWERARVALDEFPVSGLGVARRWEHSDDEAVVLAHRAEAILDRLAEPIGRAIDAQSTACSEADLRRLLAAIVDACRDPYSF